MKTTLDAWKSILVRSCPRRTYIAAHFCKSQLWHASGISFGFFLTEACAFSPRGMGLLMGLALLANAAGDVLTGRLCRRRITSARSAANWQAIAAAPTCLFFAAFAATPFVEPDTRGAFAVVTLFGFRLAYSLLDLPQNAMVALLASSTRDRIALLAARNMASGVATLAVGAVAVPAILVAGTDSSLGHIAWAIGIGLLTCLTARALGRVVADAPVPFAPARLLPLQNAALPFGQILAVLALTVSASTIFRAMEPYAAAFAGVGVGIMIWVPCGSILSQPLWTIAARGLIRAQQAGLAATATFVATIMLATPARHHPIGVALIGLGYGIGSGGLWLMLWSDLMRRAGDDCLPRLGVFTAVSKAAQAAAAFGVGHVLYLSPYRTTLADPSSPPSLMMTAALATTGLCCLALGATTPRIRRTAASSAI